MRLLIVTQMWPTPSAPHLGAFVKRQVRAFETLGVDVRVIAPRGGRTGITGAYRHASMILAARAAGRVRPDAVLAHYLFPAGEAARQAARRAGCPLIVTAHGTDVANTERSAFLRRATQRVLRDADALICVSEALRDRLQASCTTPDETHVVHMGVDTDTFHPGDRDVAAASFEADPPRPLIVQVGAKNTARLIDAVANLRGDHPTVGLWIAGAEQPSGRPQPRVRWLGRVEPRDVGRLLRAADCACLVSEREGYGLAALEAAASGIPVVVSDTAPVADDLPPACTARADPLSVDAITQALRHALTMPRDDPAAVAAAAQHSVHRQAQRTLAIITSLVTTRSGLSNTTPRIG